MSNNRDPATEPEMGQSHMILRGDSFAPLFQSQEVILFSNDLNDHEIDFLRAK